MKITRMLPRKLAIGWQEYDLNRTEGELAYHEAMAKVLKEMSDEGHAKLRRLEGGKN